MSKKKKKQIEITIDNKRAIRMLAQKAMPTIYEALVELITNCDSAYAEMHGKEYGYKEPVRLEIKRGGKQNPTYLTIKDRALGMSYEDMDDKLLKYFKYVSKTERSFFGKGFKDCIALGDITVKSAKKNEKGQILYSEIFLDSTLDASKNEIRFENEQFTKETLERFGEKKPRTGTSVEIKIEPGNSNYNPLIANLVENIPMHYALSKLLDKDEGNIKLTLFDVNEKKEHSLVYSKPEATLVSTDEKEFPNGEKATLKIWKFDELLEEDYNPKFAQLGISIFSSKGCHEKSFLDKKIENDELRKRYFGELKCPGITKLHKDYDYKLNNNIKLDEDNNTPIIEESRLTGINSEHPFIKKHLYPWATKILKTHIDEDRKKEVDDNGKKDAYLEKTLKDMFKQLSKELDIDDEADDSHSELGKTQWQIIPRGGNMIVGEKKQIRVTTFKNNLKSGINTVEFLSDKPFNFIKIKNTNLELKPLENREDVVRAIFEIEAISEGEQNFKIHHAGQLKTEFNIRVQKNQNRMFNNLLEFEHKEYTVGVNKNRNIKVFARVPDLVTTDVNLPVSIVDDSVIKQMKPCSLKVIEGTNYAEGTISVKGLKLNGKTLINISLNDNHAQTTIKVTDKEEKGSEYKPDIGPYNLGNKRATWDPEQPNVLKISTKHPVIKKFLGSENPEYPNSGNPAWLTMLWEIVCEKFAEKKVQLTARKDPDQYGDLTNYNNVEDIILQTQVFIDSTKAKFIDKYMINSIDEKKINLGSDDKDN